MELRHILIKDRSKRISFVVIVFLIILITLIFSINPINFISKLKQSSRYNCNSVVILKPSEIQFASEIAKKTKGIVVIPEEHEIIGDVDFLKYCPNFNPKDYLYGYLKK